MKDVFGAWITVILVKIGCSSALKLYFLHQFLCCSIFRTHCWSLTRTRQKMSLTISQHLQIAQQNPPTSQQLSRVVLETSLGVHNLSSYHLKMIYGLQSYEITRLENIKTRCWLHSITLSDMASFLYWLALLRNCWMWCEHTALSGL